MHYWGVWHAENPYEAYGDNISRFMSEYGFQSFPELGSVARYTAPETDWDIGRPVMLSHQRHPRGNALIRKYMERDFRAPKDFASFLYVGQVLQATVIKFAAEAHRRAMGRNWGASTGSSTTAGRSPPGPASTTTGAGRRCSTPRAVLRAGAGLARQREGRRCRSGASPIAAPTRPRASHPRARLRRAPARPPRPGLHAGRQRQPAPGLVPQKTAPRRDEPANGRPGRRDRGEGAAPLAQPLLVREDQGFELPKPHSRSTPRRTPTARSRSPSGQTRSPAPSPRQPAPSTASSTTTTSTFSPVTRRRSPSARTPQRRRGAAIWFCRAQLYVRIAPPTRRSGGHARTGRTWWSSASSKHGTFGCQADTSVASIRSGTVSTAGAQAIVLKAREAGVHATYLIWVGEPAESILEASLAEGADVIMLGSRPRTNLRRLILGSVSSEVAKRASCEVIVVPN